MIDSSTDKPAKKGRQLYVSRKIQMVETCLKNDLILFRSNIEASMTSNLYRFTCVALNKLTGYIESSRCTCEVLLSGKCSHVACLLYFIESISLNAEPLIQKACTSVPQYWGKGKKVAKNPDSFHKKIYSRKTRPDKYIFTGKQNDRNDCKLLNRASARLIGTRFWHEIQ